MSAWTAGATVGTDRAVYRIATGCLSVAAALVGAAGCGAPEPRTVDAGGSDDAAAGTADPAADAGDAERFAFEELHMGVAFRIVTWSDGADRARAAARAAFDRIAALEDILSDYDPQSELRRLGRRPAGTASPASPELVAVLRRARELSALSDGAFDVTVGPAVRLWRRSRRQRALPSPALLADARARMGWEAVVVDDDAHVTLGLPDMLLDLGGIAKGYAADEALAVLRAHDLAASLVDAGGDLALGDAPPGTDGWRIELTASPDREGERRRLANCGVATSGDAFRYVEIDGVRYSHLVDPRTGLGVTSGHAVTVVADEATTADGVASTLCVLDPEAGPRLLPDLPRVREVLYWNADGALTARHSAPTGTTGGSDRR